MKILNEYGVYSRFFGKFKLIELSSAMAGTRPTCWQLRDRLNIIIGGVCAEITT